MDLGGSAHGPAHTTAAWLVAVTVLGVLLVITQLAEGPLDDPDPAFQRPGVLDLGALPSPAPASVRDAFDGEVGLVAAERPGRLAGLCRALSAAPLHVEVLLVLPSPAPAGACPAQRVVVDPQLPAALGMRTPRDGGFPVGYAIVDADGLLRYVTLDPQMADLMDEVHTMVGAAGG